MTLIIRSPAFAGRGRIPLRHTGDGEDVSPPLQWLNLPGGTRELALIVDDPDAPTPEPWVHSLGDTLHGSGIARGGATACLAGPTSRCIAGKEFVGHRWLSRARSAPRSWNAPLSFSDLRPGAPLKLVANPDKKALLEAMEGHILDQGILTGVYQR